MGLGVQSAYDAVLKALFDDEKEGEKVSVIKNPCLPGGYTYYRGSRDDTTCSDDADGFFTSFRFGCGFVGCINRLHS